MNLNDASKPPGPTSSLETDIGALGGGRATIRILIATNTRLYREGLVLILSGYPDLVVAGWGTNASEAVLRLRETEAQVVLLDMAMPESQPLAREITASTPDVQVVALAIPCSERAVLECAESGVTGYVLREASADDLISALRSAGSGELRCPPSVAAILRRRLTVPMDAPGVAHASRLTLRERQILGLVDEGLGNKAIAQRLGIEVATVKNHVHNILEKLSVHRRGQAAANARSHLNPLDQKA
jgi:DNA-binding NarL/FixJ family response regulator